MGFATFETSRAQGAPITRFLFRYGSDPAAFFAYTDHEQVITDPGTGVEYLPIPMKRGNIVASGSLDKAMLQIRSPQNSDVANLFLIYPPSQTVTLVISQGHLSDDDQQFLVVWTGRVLSCSREGSEAVFSCEPVSTSMRRPGLRRNYQYGCPHVLYGSECKASMAAATKEVEVFGVLPYSVNMRDEWEDPAVIPKYLGGMFAWDGTSGKEYRTILRIVNLNELWLSGLTRDLTVGMTAEAIYGCDHRGGKNDDCINLHNNIHNYGGQMWIPIKNPIGVVNNFY